MSCRMHCLAAPCDLLDASVDEKALIRLWSLARATLTGAEREFAR